MNPSTAPTTESRRRPTFIIPSEDERRRKGLEMARKLREWIENPEDEDYDILAALDANRRANGDVRMLTPDEGGAATDEREA